MTMITFSVRLHRFSMVTLLLRAESLMRTSKLQQGILGSVLFTTSCVPQRLATDEHLTFNRFTVVWRCMCVMGDANLAGLQSPARAA